MVSGGAMINTIHYSSKNYEIHALLIGRSLQQIFLKLSLNTTSHFMPALVFTIKRYLNYNNH